MEEKRDDRDMSVRDAGQKGGERVRKLINDGKEAEGGTSSSNDDTRSEMEDEREV